LDNQFFEALLYSRDLRLFRSGAHRHVPAKPWNVRTLLDQDKWKEVSKTELRTPWGTGIVNPELYSYFSNETERAAAYFTTFLVTGDLGLVSRTEQKEDDGVPLTGINPSSVDVDAKRNSQIQRTVTTDASMLKVNGKKCLNYA
jgi:hypothetical protein